MTREESECWASAQRWHEKYLKAEAEIERLTEENKQMRAVLAKFQEPNSNREAQVAEWLRDRGYVVTDEEPLFGPKDC